MLTLTGNAHPAFTDGVLDVIPQRIVVLALPGAAGIHLDLFPGHVAVLGISGQVGPMEVSRSEVFVGPSRGSVGCLVVGAEQGIVLIVIGAHANILSIPAALSVKVGLSIWRGIGIKAAPILRTPGCGTLVDVDRMEAVYDPVGFIHPIIGGCYFNQGSAAPHAFGIYVCLVLRNTGIHQVAEQAA